MRRWRTKDDRFLVEADLPSGIQFYRLDSELQVERVYKEERNSMDGELHKVSFSLLGRQLMCRHTVDRSRNIEDRSRVELDGLELLMPTEQPLEKVCREAIERYKHGSEKVDAAKKAQVDKLAMAAPESIRPTFRRLAKRVVFENDPISREMMSVFAKLGALRKQRDTEDVALSVAPLVELAAQLITADPAAANAEIPALPTSKALELATTLEQLRSKVLAAKGHGSNVVEVGSSEAAYVRAADVLWLATIELLISAKS